MTELKQKQVTQDQRIRGPKLTFLTELKDRFPFEETLAMANAGNYVIASNKRLSQVLIGSKEWKTITEVFACWTGTMTAYVKPGEKLGKTVEYIDPGTNYRWIFPVPVEYQGKADAILVSEHPDYNLEIDGKTKIVHAAKVDLIEKFPPNKGWYLTDAQHGIPIGEALNVKKNYAAQHLDRSDSRVGPVACGYWYDLGVNIRLVYLYTWPSICLGVAVEAE